MLRRRKILRKRRILLKAVKACEKNEWQNSVGLVTWQDLEEDLGDRKMTTRRKGRTTSVASFRRDVPSS